MKTILLIISIMLFGLYSCGDEVTNLTPTPDQETKKYTLEEILADSNWVEVDTVNLEQSGFCIAVEQYSDTVLKISNIEDYNILFDKNLSFSPYIKDSSTSCYFNYKVPEFDFKKYDNFLSIASTIPSTQISFKYIIII